MTAPEIVVAIPAHRDETGLAATIEAFAGQLRELGVTHRIDVCVNGIDPTGGPAWRDAVAVEGPVEVTELGLGSKAAAWNVLRHRDGDVVVFADADVLPAPHAVDQLTKAIGDGVSGPTVAVARQVPLRATTRAARAASVPFRYPFGGVTGTLYAARRDRLPSEMPEVLLDDAWLWAAVGGSAQVVEEARVGFVPAHTWGDLWRQRVRAEAGKRQLAEMGVGLAPPPADLSPFGVLVRYPPQEWPAVLALTALKVAARLRVRFGGAVEWGRASSTKAS